MLEDAICAIERTGDQVVVAVVGRRPPAPPAGGWARPYVDVPAPSTWRVLANVASAAVGGRSLNECVFDGPRQRAVLRRLADESQADVVVADTLRAWGLAVATGRPVVLALDDLLSARYRRAASRRAGRRRTPVLGSYGASLPAPVRVAGELVARSLLRVEARRCMRRERAAARAAAAVTLVSPAEAAELASVTGREVVASSIAVPEPVAVGDLDLGGGLMFVGGLDYGPNVEALRWWAAEVVPALRAAGQDPALDVAGHVPPSLAPLPGGSGVRLHGFVEDLAAMAARDGIFVAPLLDPGGMKIKVVEAMGRGQAVVATPAAVAALPVEDGRHCLVAADGGAFAAAIRRLRTEPGLARAIGAAAQQLVQEELSTAALDARWRRLLGAARP